MTTSQVYQATRRAINQILHSPGVGRHVDMTAHCSRFQPLLNISQSTFSSYLTALITSALLSIIRQTNTVIFSVCST